MERHENIYHVYNDYAEIEISGGKYNGTKAIIDVDNVEICKAHHWNIGQYKGKLFFRNSSSRLPLSSYIIKIPNTMSVIHKDRNMFNNKRGNLEIRQFKAKFGYRKY